MKIRKKEFEMSDERKIPNVPFRVWVAVYFSSVALIMLGAMIFNYLMVPSQTEALGRLTKTEAVVLQQDRRAAGSLDLTEEDLSLTADSLRFFRQYRGVHQWYNTCSGDRASEFVSLDHQCLFQVWSQTSEGFIFHKEFGVTLRVPGVSDSLEAIYTVSPDSLKISSTQQVLVMDVQKASFVSSFWHLLASVGLPGGLAALVLGFLVTVFIAGTNRATFGVEINE